MINRGALLMATVMTAVAAGTYFGLDMLPPGTIPPPFGRNPPASAHTIAANSVAETGAAAAPAAAPAPAPAAAAPAAESAPATAAAPTEQELAEEPAPKPAPKAAPAEPEKVAAAEAPAAPAPKAEAAAAPAPVEAKPEPKPAPKAEKPAPAPKSAEPAPEAVASAAPATAEPEEPEAPKTPSKTSADADLIKQWWPDPSKLPANQLKLIYAGDVQGETAVALLFSDAPNVDSLKMHAHVRDMSGAAVGGTWAPGKNPRLVVFRGLQAGTRYTVILDKELASASGFALGQTLQGPVYLPNR